MAIWHMFGSEMAAWSSLASPKSKLPRQRMAATHCCTSAFSCCSMPMSAIACTTCDVAARSRGA